MKRKKLYPYWLNNIGQELLKMRLHVKVVFILMGILSTCWFLVRVIPKPVRATYPCMQAAAPFMSAFVIYLIGLTTSVFALRKSRDLLRKARYLTGFIMILVPVLSLMVVSSIQAKKSFAREINEYQEYIPNEPMGKAKGIFPGRVVWVHERDVTNDDCTNTFNKDGKVDEQDDVYFQDKNTYQDTVDRMLDMAMLALTGKSTLPDAWDAVFKWFNNTWKDKGLVGYQAGEKVLIKVNRTSSSQGSNTDLSRNDTKNWHNLVETSPQIMLSLLRHLIHHACIPQGNIYIGDAQRMLYQDDVDKMAAEFPNVNYLGKDSHQGRTPLSTLPLPRLWFSDSTTITEKQADGLYDIYAEASYLITVPALKTHSAGGITSCVKNHFGSQSENSAYYLHPGLVEYNGLRNRYGMYRILTDIMGSKYLGRNTLINIVDAIWCGSDWNGPPDKFRNPPFNGQFTSSILVSLDQVAIESVGFDILRSEYTSSNGYAEIFPNYGAVDDFLHQAADSANWPDGITYDPDHSGTPMPSMGTHEHWNSLEQRQYSRNLGTGDGIELLYINLDTAGATGIHAQKAGSGLGLYPNPAIRYSNLEFHNAYKGIVEIQIYNACGQLVHSDRVSKRQDHFHLILDLSAFEKGAYVVRARFMDNELSSRLLVR